MALRVHNWTPLLDAQAGTQRCDKRGCGRVWYATSIQPGNDCPGIDTPDSEASASVGKVIPNIPPPNSGMSYMERMFGFPDEVINPEGRHKEFLTAIEDTDARIAEAVAFDEVRSRRRGYWDDTPSGNG